MNGSVSTGLDDVKGGARPRLHAIALELTRYCNQKCGYCYNAWRGEPQARGAAQDRWPARVARLLAAFEIDHFTLTGGEPFAYRGVFDVMGQIRDAGVGLQLISNGGLIDDAIAQRLSHYAPRFVQVTLNGPERALHEAHVGPDCFDATIRGIRALRSAGVTVVGCIVLTRQNAAHVDAILQRFRELDVQQIALSRFSPAGYASEQVAELLPSIEDVSTALEQAQAVAEQGEMHITSTMPLPPCAIEVERFGAIRMGVCAIGTSGQEFAVGPDGRMRNCTLHDACVGEAYDVADENADLPALIQSADVREYRARAVPEFCKGCRHEQTCSGGCGAAVRWIFGELGAQVDPLVAQHTDDRFAERLRRGRRRLWVSS